MNEELKERYFKWLCKFVPTKQSFQKLLRTLMSVEFTYILQMDENRAFDGIELRYRFGDENDIPQSAIATCLDVGPCSVLEMLIALSVRCETHIMSNEADGDRTAIWFWDWIKNLGLYGMTDEGCVEEYIVQRLSIFLNRQYDRYGRGGNIFIFDAKELDGKDVRKFEIWAQAMWYFDRYFQF